MENQQKSNRDSRKNKEKNKTSKYFGSQKHIRIKLDKVQKKIKEKS
jgi:hypothetical protein